MASEENKEAKKPEPPKGLVRKGAKIVKPKPPKGTENKSLDDSDMEKK